MKQLLSNLVPGFVGMFLFALTIGLMSPAYALPPCGLVCFPCTTSAVNCQDCCDANCFNHDPHAGSPWFNCYLRCDCECTG